MAENPWLYLILLTQPEISVFYWCSPVTIKPPPASFAWCIHFSFTISQLLSTHLFSAIRVHGVLKGVNTAGLRQTFLQDCCYPYKDLLASLAIGWYLGNLDLGKKVNQGIQRIRTTGMCIYADRDYKELAHMTKSYWWWVQNMWGGHASLRPRTVNCAIPAYRMPGRDPAELIQSPKAICSRIPSCLERRIFCFPSGLLLLSRWGSCTWRRTVFLLKYSLI